MPKRFKQGARRLALTGMRYFHEEWWDAPEGRRQPWTPMRADLRLPIRCAAPFLLQRSSTNIGALTVPLPQEVIA